MNYPSRKNLRLPEYDYSMNGAYFVTISTHRRQRTLSSITEATPNTLPVLKLTKLVTIAQNTFQLLEERFGIKIDYYSIVPDHIHFIFFIDVPRATARVAPTVGTVVGAYKSLIAYYQKRKRSAGVQKAY